MVKLTRLNRQAIVINAEVIAFVESDPDTLVVLTNGDRVHVRETVDELVASVIAYRRRIVSGVYDAVPRVDE